MSTFSIWYRSQPVALRTIVAINVAVFVLCFLSPVRGFVSEFLALQPALPGVLLEAWQLVTYNFVHFRFFHVLFNMLWLYWIGQEYEDLYGPHRMLALYILGGMGGGLASVLGYSTVLAGNPMILGASGSVLALLAAVVTLNPQKRIRLFLFGSVRLLYIVVGYLLLNLLRPGSVAVLAHLGGAAAGYLFVQAQERGLDVTSWAKVFFSASQRARGGYATGRSGTSGGSVFGGLFSSKGASSGASASTGRESPREQRDRKRRREVERRREVDRILEKISAEGYEALSDEEKRTLEDASRQ